jgi:hypothetical protein
MTLLQGTMSGEFRNHMLVATPTAAVAQAAATLLMIIAAGSNTI